jgi:uncharacterized protein (DUF1501 family)
MHLSPTRRQFLQMTGSLGLTAGAAVLLDKLALSTALAQTWTDYKALVCIYLFGGADANNLVVPLSGAPGFGSADVTLGYPAYSAERSGPGLAIAAPPATGTEPPDTLLRISPGAANPNLGMFGLHPQLGTTFNSTTGTTTIPIPGLRSMYAQNKMAVVCNVGSLFQRISKADYLAGIGRPDQLFSHSDQIRQHQTCIFTAVYPNGVPSGTGWGGRTADKVTLNGSANFPMQTSISGAPQFMNAATTFPLVVNPAPTGLNQLLVLSGFGTTPQDTARRRALANLLTLEPGANKIVDASNQVLQNALSVSAALSVDPVLSVPDPNNPGNKIALTFPNTNLGNQLKQVAKIIKANLQQSALALKRQIFFCEVSGFDTHQSENANLPGLIQQFNEATATFYYWLQNNVPTNAGEPTLGDLRAKVTTFTQSDFNRTFSPSGSGGNVGSDHAWGTHLFVMGGAVAGGRFYGIPLPSGNGTVYPTLSKGTASPYDAETGTGRGRWVPSVSTMQFANTLAAWYGLPQDNATLDYVFPLLRTNFPTTNLGFV